MFAGIRLPARHRSRCHIHQTTRLHTYNNIYIPGLHHYVCLIYIYSQVWRLAIRHRSQCDMQQATCYMYIYSKPAPLCMSRHYLCRIYISAGMKTCRKASVTMRLSTDDSFTYIWYIYIPGLYHCVQLMNIFAGMKTRRKASVTMWHATDDLLHGYIYTFQVCIIVYI